MPGVQRSHGQLETNAVNDAPRVKGSGNFGGTLLTFRSVLGPVMKPLPEFPTPPGGGAARINISDNNKALPMDRIFFTYNHFKNALQVIPGAESQQAPRQFSISRYILGFEKTLFCDCHSMEVRMPVTGTYQDAIPGFSVAGQNAGNLGLIYKMLLTRTDTWSSVIGLGLGLPTGTDIDGRVQDVGYKLQNETVHVLPYTGLLVAPNEQAFYHAFLQLDLAANGNPVFATPVSADRSTTLGVMNEQNLLHIDASAGRWLYRNTCQQCRPALTGIAALGELHYITSLQDADQVGGVLDDILLEFGNIYNRVDVLNATVGIHVEFAENTALRVGAALPLKRFPDRAFDAEVMVQLNHEF